MARENVTVTISHETNQGPVITRIEAATIEETPFALTVYESETEFSVIPMTKIYSYDVVIL